MGQGEVGFSWRKIELVNASALFREKSLMFECFFFFYPQPCGWLAVWGERRQGGTA